MATEEWEKGAFKLSCSEYARVKKVFRNDYNNIIANLTAVSGNVYQKTIEAGKGKRNFDWRGAARKSIPLNNLANHFHSIIINTMFPEGRDGRPTRPRKKDFPTATSKTASFSAGNAEISFDDASRTIIWSVESSDRGVRTSWEHPVGIAFKNVLDSITWSRNTGGSIYGGDDYDDPDDIPCISLKYGILGEKDDLNLRNARRAMAGLPPIKT